SGRRPRPPVRALLACRAGSQAGTRGRRPRPLDRARDGHRTRRQRQRGERPRRRRAVLRTAPPRGDLSLLSDRSQRAPTRRAESPYMNAAPKPPQVEIVVPVYNEQAALRGSIHRLHAYLTTHFPFSWRIVVADNASVDDTLTIARRLADELRNVRVVHLDQKGRGRALRAAWAES